MKFASQLQKNTIPEWTSQYIAYKGLKKKIKEIKRWRNQGQSTPVDLTIQTNIDAKEQEFWDFLVAERDSVESFYNDRCNIIQERFQALLHQIQQLDSETNGSKEHYNAKAILKHAFFQFYRQIALLRNFAVLNSTGFAKIVKKHDKYCFHAIERRFFSDKQNFKFETRHEVDQLLSQTENIYTETFFKGNRHLAMQHLRVDSRMATPALGFRFGIFLGLSVFPLAYILWKTFTFSWLDADFAPDGVGALAVYRMIGLIILAVFLFGGNVLGWVRARINYVFIFELNPRTTRTSLKYFEGASILLFLWSLSLSGYLLGAIDGVLIFNVIPPWIYPFTMFLFSVLILFNPLPIFGRGPRFMILKTMGKIALAPFYKVYFRDFYLADWETSLILVFMDLGTVLCFYTADLWTGTGRCFASQKFYRPIIMVFPPLWRLLQCVRRYRDTAQKFPHLANALKYFGSVLVTCMNNIAKHFELIALGSSSAWALRIIWGACALASALYLIWWDIKMDWGLWKPGSKVPLLRNHRIYKHTWVYYFAIGSNSILRFAWILAISPLQPPMHLEAFLLIVALIELVRRFQWGFFRLEHEHINNSEEYRVVVDVPLPYGVAGETTADAQALADGPMRPISHEEFVRVEPIPVPGYDDEEERNTDDRVEFYPSENTRPKHTRSERSLGRRVVVKHAVAGDWEETPAIELQRCNSELVLPFPKSDRT